MFEPLTQTVGQLALRWNYSVQDVLTHALHRNWPLYFYFDGLVFDVNDRKNRFGGCDRQIEEAAWLEKTIAQAEETLTRNSLRAQGKLEMTQWEEVLSDEAMRALRKTTDENTVLLRAQHESIQAWHEGRKQFHRNGAVRAAPGTLQSIADKGAISFPIRAYHPDSPAWFISDPDGPGQLLEGRLVALEDVGTHPKAKLTADDLFANMADVKAIEAANAVTSNAVAPTEVARQNHSGTATSKPAIPGKPPTKGAGQVAIGVAWAIEWESGVKPTAKEVIARMRELANSGENYADVLRSTPSDVPGVNWMTKKREQRNFSIEALEAALSRWSESRQ